MTDPEEIQEFVRVDNPRRFPFGGCLALIMLILVGAGLFVGAGVVLRNDQERAAIEGTVSGFRTDTPTPTVAIVVEQPEETATETASPSETPAATEAPTETAQATAESAEPTATADGAPTETGTPIGEARPTRTFTPGPSPTNSAAGATSTPVATDTPPPATAAGGANGVTGTLTLCNPAKTTYARSVEGVCFIETIVNNTGATISYGVLGVQYVNQATGAAQFHTSWSGDLSIAANCTGPSGTCGGPWRDEGLKIDVAGAYALSMAMCFSDIDACLGTSGNWETLSSGIVVTIVD